MRTISSLDKCEEIVRTDFSAKSLFSMSKCDKLLSKVRNSADNISFSEICRLAECFGFEFQRQKGSHVIYENPNLEIDQNRLINFQNFKGKAKSYQVKQLLKAISYLENDR